MGVLFFAKHPALKSIALISSIGILSVYIISNIIPPFLFKVLVKARHTVRPLKFSALFSAVIIYSFFTIGTLTLTVIAIFLNCSPAPGENKKKHIDFTYNALMQADSALLFNISILFKSDY